MRISFKRGGYDNLAKVKQELAIARSILPPDSPMPLNIGVGFLGWVLEQKVEAVEVFEHVLEYGVKAVWLAFGNDLGKWISLVRKYDEEHGRVDELQRTLIVVQVNSVEEAVIAANKWKVDVLVLQGMLYTPIPLACKST
jgi:nitronate monooxygenase